MRCVSGCREWAVLMEIDGQIKTTRGFTFFALAMEDIVRANFAVPDIAAQLAQQKDPHPSRIAEDWDSDKWSTEEPPNSTFNALGHRYVLARYRSSLFSITTRSAFLLATLSPLPLPEKIYR